MKKENLISPIAGIMVALTLLNLAFTYFIVDYKIKENEYRTYGSKENYEKILMINEANYNQAFKDLTKEKLKENLKQDSSGGWNNQEEMEEKSSWTISKEDLVVKTPVYGKKDAKFSIYEFWDLECPACQGFHKSGVAKDAVNKNSENLNYVYKNFQFHSWAPMKWQLALCAFEQGWEETYFKFVDGIFNEKYFPRTDENDTLAIWESLGLDKTKLKECLDSGKYSETLRSDMELWYSLWVNSTPSIFVVNNETWEIKRLRSRSVSAIEELMK